MTDTDWIAEKATELAIVTIYPRDRWLAALELVAERPDRDDWVNFVRNTYVLPERLPTMLAVVDAHAEVARSDAAKAAPDVVLDLERMAQATRRRLGLGPTAPLQIDLGAKAAQCIADIAAAEVADWLESLGE